MKKVLDKLEWKNIDHETYRTYIFPTYRTYIFPNAEPVIIDEPVMLNVSESGGHRIIDKKDVAYYIPSGWVHLFWETIDDVAFRF